MTEHQNVQSLLPFQVKAHMDSLSFEDKARVETLHSWFQSFFCFDDMARIALTEEERLSVEEEKQLFLNEIGLDEYTLKSMLTHGIYFFIKAGRASTDEELQSIVEERDCFFKDNLNFVPALDKYIREKKQKSTAPAA